jgi:predicted dehydrogenase
MPLSKVKVGIIGLGDWGVCHLQALQSLPQFEVTAVCDLNEARMRELADRYGIAGVYGNSAELCADPGLDLVIVATYEKGHLEPTLQALRAGKHVLVEKPVSTVAAEAREMQRVAAEQGRIIVPGHVLRFDSRYASVRRAIAVGAIGKPVSLYMKRSRPKSMFAIYKRTHTVYMSTVHDLDIALWCAGSRVRKVKAWGRRVTGADVPDLLWATLEFANGAIAVLESDWLTPDRAGVGTNDYLEVIGDAGTVRLDASNPGWRMWNDADGAIPADVHFHYGLADVFAGALKEQLGYVCRCIAEGRQPDYISFADAVHVIEVANAIEQSIDSGREVELE